MDDDDGGPARRRKRQRYKAPAAQARKRRLRAGGGGGGDGADRQDGAGDDHDGAAARAGPAMARGRMRPATLTEVKGGAAFFFMCSAGSEKRTAGQMRDWIEEIADAVAAERDDDDDEDDEKAAAASKAAVVDVQRELQAELQAFKTQLPRLQTVSLPPKARALAILKLNEPAANEEGKKDSKTTVDPVEIARRMVHSCAETGVNRVKSCIRAVPAQTCCHSREADIKAACGPILARFFAQRPAEMRTFAVQLRRRFCDHLNRDATIKAVADAVAEAAPKDDQGASMVKVDLKNPSFTVLIETCAGLAGVSVVDETAQSLHKFNLEAACAQAEAQSS